MEPSPESSEETPAPGYRRWAAERVAASAFVLWGSLSIVFLLFYVVPADPARQFAGKGANFRTVEAARAHLHLDDPLYEQYGVFLGRVLSGNLGYSWYNRVSVNEIVADAAPVTGSVVVGAMVFALLVGLPVGLASARRKKPSRRPAAAFVYLGVGIHPIWLALLLLHLLWYKLDLFPPGGYADFFNAPPGQPGGPVQWAYHLVLPWITQGLAVAAVYIRVVNQLVRENSPTLPVKAAKRLLLDLGWIIGVTFFVEVLFALPGLGRTMFGALNNYDIPTIQGILVFLVGAQILLYLAGNLVGGAISKDWRRT